MTPQRSSTDEHRGESGEIHNLVVSLVRLKKLLEHASIHRMLTTHKEPLFKDGVRG